MSEDGGENPTVEQVRKRATWDNDDYVCRGLILNGMSDSLFYIYQNVETSKELWDTLEAKYMVEDASSKNFLASNVGNTANGSSTKGSEDGSSNPLKGHSMFNKSHQIYYVTYISEAFFVQDDDVAWWVDFGATVHVCKDRCWFKTYESPNDGSILHMRNESTALVHGCGCVDLRLGHVHFKWMQDMSKNGLIPAIDMDTKECKTYMLNKITKKPFQNIKRKTKVLELIHNALCGLHATPSLGNKKYFVIFIDDASRAVVRILDPKLKSLGERGIECIFVGYDEHFKAFRFYVIKPNDSVAINSIIESRNVIFDEQRFSSVPRPSQRSLVKGTANSGGLVVSERVTNEIVQQFESQLRKSKRHKTPKDFGPEFQLYLIEGTRDEVSDQKFYCFNVKDDPKTFDKAMKSQDVAFWKEAINDEMDSIMGNNTWVLTDLPLGIDYFDTYALVARISTIRLLIAMASIHNLIIHQMDVKKAFLNGGLEKEHAPKQWHQKFDEVVLSNGYSLNQADKCVYNKFGASGKGVIICLYVDEMLIFGTDQEIFVIKVLYEGHEGVTTPMDTCEKLMPNIGMAISQLEYSRVIGCLMYFMTCSRPDITFVVRKLSRYTSNPGTQHWQAIQRVLKYLKKTMDYRLVYSGYPSVLEGYTNVSWISNTEDNSSTSGLVFLLSGGAISWASKKQTFITGSTIESEFVALAAAAKAYSKMYNGKSRHLGVRHSMIRELITNGVVSIEFVRLKQNLADHLTNGLARDLVIKSAEGMGLKSI
nr:zinc finger, CCHC-type [Tanacetum cinerariifolium]